MVKPDDALSPCGQEVRKHDNDRFLTCLFAPADRREGLFALYAFNHEIAKTREVVSEPVLGQIRLQWWRDGIAAVYEGAPPRHAVLDPLAESVTRYGLSRDLFETLIEARETDLTDEPPPDRAALLAYAEATGAPLVQLALEVLGVRETAAAEAGRHVGIAVALAGLLRAVPFRARQHRLFLPTDLLARHRVSPQSVLDLHPQPGLAAVTAEIAGLARDHLSRARALRRSVPRPALPALLPAVLADLYLGVIHRAGNDVFAPRVQMPNPFRSPRLALSATLGRY
jgi:phytoene synthase